jgi:hypothetical protein
MIASVAKSIGTHKVTLRVSFRPIPALEARLDYETNLRAEPQIASFHDKIDLFLDMAAEPARRRTLRREKDGLISNPERQAVICPRY